MNPVHVTHLVNVHQGVPLPIARVVVIVIPVVLISIFVWLRRHR